MCKNAWKCRNQADDLLGFRHFSGAPGAKFIRSCRQILMHENLSAGMLVLSAMLHEHRILQMRQIAE